MSLGQNTANKLNDKFEQETEDSFLQRYYRDNPLAKVATSLGRIPIAMAASALGGPAGMLAAGATLGAGGLLSTSNKQLENRRVVDYKRAEGLQNAAPGSFGLINDPMRSMSNAAGSMANPLMMAGLGSQAAGMMGIPGIGAMAPGLMQTSMALRSPAMALQLAGGMGLTKAMSGAVGADAIDAGTKIAAEHGTMGSFGLNASLLPSTLLHGAGGLMSGAGGLASMVGAESVGSALGAGGSALHGASDSLLSMLGSAAADGGLGLLAGPLLGMMTSMAIKKPIGAAMNSFREKATGTKLQKQGKALRPLVRPAHELIKRYSLTRQLDMQTQMLGNTGQLKSFEWMVLSYLGAIEKPLSLLGFVVEQMQTASEMARVGGNNVQNSLQTKFGFSGDAEEDLTAAHATQDTRGIHNFFTRDEEGNRELSGGDFMQNPMQYIKSSMAKGFLGLEKKALQASAIVNPMNYLMGGKHSVGTKLKNIRDKEQTGKIAQEMSRATGIPTSGIIAMETTAVTLANSGNTIDDKKLAIMGGTYELIRLSTFFLQDIRTAMGVTKESSMLGKMQSIQTETASRGDRRSDKEKGKAEWYDFFDKVPVLSFYGAYKDWSSRSKAKKAGLMDEEGKHAETVAEEMLTGEESVSSKNSMTNRMVFALDMIRHSVEDIVTSITYQVNTGEQMLDSLTNSEKTLDYLSSCPCNEKPKMALGGFYTEPGVVPGASTPPGVDTFNAVLKPKEFIVRAERATENKELLEAVNSSKSPDVLTKMLSALEEQTAVLKETYVLNLDVFGNIKFLKDISKYTKKTVLLMSKFTASVKGIFGKLQSTMKGLVKWQMKMAKSVLSLPITLTKWQLGIAKKGVGWVRDKVKSVNQQVQEKATAAGEMVGGGINTVRDKVKSVNQRVQEKATAAGEMVGGGINAVREYANKDKKQDNVFTKWGKNLTEFSKEKRGSADATDAKLEKEQAEEEAISREQKMVDTVVNIEKILKECCTKKKGLFSGVLGKKKDSEGKGLMGDVLGGIVGAGTLGALGLAGTGIAALAGFGLRLVGAMVGLAGWPLLVTAILGAGVWYAIDKGFENYKKAEKHLKKNKVKMAEMQQEKEEKYTKEMSNPESKTRKKFEKHLDEKQKIHDWYKELKDSGEFDKLSPAEKVKANQKMVKASQHKYDVEEKKIVSGRVVSKPKEANPIQQYVKANPSAPTITLSEEGYVNKPEWTKATVKEETVQDIRNKTEVPTDQTRQMVIKRKEQEEAEQKEREEKNISLNEDIVDGIYGVQKQTNALANIIIEMQVGSVDTNEGVGRVMQASLNELRKISGSNQEIAVKTTDNKNRIVQRA